METQTRGGDGGGSSSASQNGNRFDGVVNLLSTVCLELCKPNNRNASQATSPAPSLASRQPHGTFATNSAACQQETLDPDHSLEPVLSQPRKRRRLDSCGNPNIDLHLPLEDLVDASSNLPPAELLEDIVNVYFTKIQPWIPVLHETLFRARMHDADQLPALVVIIHAMVVAAIRFAQPETHGLSFQDIECWAKRSRSIVVLTAMDSLSVENLQALIIIAFDDVRV